MIEDTEVRDYSSVEYNDLYADYQATLGRERALLDDIHRLSREVRASLERCIDVIKDRYYE